VSDAFIFAFGLVAFLFAVGPLAYAAFLDLRAEKTLELRDDERPES